MLQRGRPPNPEPPKVVWRPLPGSQALIMACPCNHILYEGTRGPGKTDAQLMYFRKNVGRGYGKFWRGIIFDREYKNLDDLVSKSQRWYPRFEDGAKFHASKADYRWTWPTGEELLFRQVKRLSDYWGYHGQEFPFIGWNELSKYPTSELYEAMMSCNRTSFRPQDYPLSDGTLLPEIPLVVFSTTNPYGAGHNWVKSRFIDPAKPGQVIRNEVETFNPRTQQREKIVRTQVRIFGSYKENIYLSPEYVAELESIKDKNKRKAWLWGDWDVVAGGAIDDVWDPAVHIVPRFKIPYQWRIDRTMDWGSSHPFSVGFWAEANGEEVRLDEPVYDEDTGLPLIGQYKTFCPPKGSLIRFHEWYGSEEVGTNKGLKLSAADVARGIKALETKLKQEGWISSNVSPGPADNQIFEVREKDSDTIAKRMEDQGIYWTHSDKSPGSRKNGLQLLRDRLEAGVKGEGASIYFMDHCRATLATLPVLPRDENDPDDVDTAAEDHAYDDIRYRVLSGNSRYATVIKMKFAR
jgi:hypothetical protein